MSSFGEELRRERELRQISLREVSEATKINVRYLEALERNDFRHLPGGVFNKGFVRAYAQFIGVDPEAMVNSYLLQEQAQEDDGSSGDGEVIRRPPRPLDEPAEKPPPSLPVRRIVGVAGVVVVAIALAGLAYWWWQSGDGPPADPPRAGEAVSEPRVDAVEATSAEEGDGDTAGGDQEVTEAVRDETGQEPVGGDAPLPAGTDPEGEVSIASSEPRSVPAGTGTVVARIVVDRSTAGRVNCDNRRVETLEGLLPGTELTFECERFLLVSAADGGAVRVGLDGSPLTALGPDGAAVIDQRFVPRRREVDR